METIVNLIKNSFDKLELQSSDKKELKSQISDAGYDVHKLNVLRSKVYDLVKEKTSDVDTIKLVNWLEEINKVLLPKKTGDSDAENRSYFSPGDDCENAIIQSIKKATKSIKICVFTISDNDITAEIISAHKRGVSVKVITDNDKLNDRGSDIRTIADAGVIVKIDQTSSHMHHKFCIVDKAILLTGSYNWTRSAAERNQENVLVTDESKVVRSYLHEFEKLWDQFVIF
jgi:cardiolipin hydrolase